MGSRGIISKKRKTANSVRTAQGVKLRPLPGEADAIFKRLAKDIDRLEPGDVGLVELQAYWLEIAKEARRQLAIIAPADADAPRLTLTVTDTTHGDGTEPRKHPLLIVLRTATEQVRAIAAQLGASPMARARLPEVDAEGQMSFGEQFFQAAAAALKARQEG